MLKRLSKKESREVVTKGYFHITLDEILDYRFEKFRKEFRKEINQDFAYHTGILMEDNHDTIKILIESFENRFESIEKRLGVIS